MSAGNSELLAQGEAAFEAVRPLANRRFTQRPALIARARGAEDVSLAIAFAREHGLEIAVRSGATVRPATAAAREC